MPCSDGGYYDSLARETQQARLDLTTRIACEYLSGLEAELKPIPEYAAHWWRQHKIEDAERAEREREQRVHQEARRRADELFHQLLREGAPIKSQ